MKELIAVAWDDLDLPERKEAAQTVTVGFNGIWRQLDLTDEHAEELAKLLGPYLEAGCEPPNRPSPPRRGSSRDYNRGMREFAERNSIRYKSGRGAIYYSRKLRELYADHLSRSGS